MLGLPDLTLLWLPAARVAARVTTHAVDVPDVFFRDTHTESTTGIIPPFVVHARTDRTRLNLRSLPVRSKRAAPLRLSSDATPVAEKETERHPSPDARRSMAAGGGATTATETGGKENEIRAPRVSRHCVPRFA